MSRRNLTPFQRAELALKLKPLIAASELEARLAALEKAADELSHRPGGRPF